MIYDYIIVGGGSAGCVLAHRLSQDPGNRVLLLEAGGSDRHALFSMPAGFAKMTKGKAAWGWRTVPQKHLKNRVLNYTQAKIIGGGSSINAQIYTRGAAADYDQWANECGATGWAYRQVLPYFKRAEKNQRFVNRYHGDEGPLGVSNPISPLPICEAFFRAGQQMGIPFNPDFNGATQDGLGYYQLTQFNAKRASTSAAYLRPALNRPNLTVVLGALAHRVVLSNQRAIGVEAAVPNADRPLLYQAAREVIVCSGAIGSPKLLLQSGIGPADHLHAVGIKVEHALPGVGSNLQDHLNLYAIAECNGMHTYDAYRKPHMAVWAGLQYLLLKNGPVASSLFETGGFWYADSAAGSPDIQLHLGLGSGIEAGVAHMRHAGVTLNSAFLHPRSRGTVRLADANPATAPLIDPNYYADPYDLEMSIKGLRLAREILAQAALGPYVQAERLPGPNSLSDAQLFEYACAHAKTDHHPVGTCRMGPGEEAVVGNDLKVHGIEAMRVVDASVMPRLTSSNTNAPTIMIAEKAADLILGKTPEPEAAS